MRDEQRGPPLQPTPSVNPRGEERDAKAKPYLIPKRWVQRAFARVKANRGAAGVDGESLARFEKDLKDNLYKVWNRMASGSYFPPPVRRVEIPKRDGGLRPLGIPTVGDRVAQAVVKQVLEPALERVFHPDSYGYRPKKSAHDALAVTRARCWQYDWVIDLDIKGFFDSMPHELVERAVARHTELPWVRLYVARWLRAPVQERDGTLSPRTKGTPQGGVVSPLLANLFLHYAFDAWMQRQYGAVPFARYADDIIVHCRTEGEARAVLGAIRDRLGQCGLELHPTKTRIVYCKQQGRRGKAEHVSFDFLGYTFQPRAARNRRGRVFLSFLPAISARAARAIRARIRAWRLTAKTHLQLSDLAVLTNATVRGWVNYYGRWYRSACLRVLRALNRALERWVHRKFKRCRQSWQASRQWVQRAAHRSPQLFALWELGAPP